MKHRICILLTLILALTVLFLVPRAQAGWDVAEIPVSNWEIYNVHFVSPTNGWAVGWDQPNNRGGILHYDGTWKPVTPPDAGSSDWYINDVHFVSAGEGWAVGFDAMNNKGLVLHYDGSWSIVPILYTSPNWNLRSIYFTSASEGWAAGYDRSKNRGIVLHYVKGSWMLDILPYIASVQWELYGVYFTSANEGWAVGGDFGNNKGVLLHYSSGSWRIVEPPDVGPFWYLESVHFTSSGEGWAVGYDSNGKGAILHYAKGSWTVVVPSSLETGFELFSVRFVTPGEGWAAGYDLTKGKSLLIHYLNGSWSTVNLPASANPYFLTGLDFTSSDSGWAVGADGNGKGIILKYTFAPVPAISVKPSSVNFGTVRVDTVSVQTLTVQNKGTANLILGTIENPSSPFGLDQGSCGTGKVLAPGNSCSMSVSFAPTTAVLSSSQSDIPSNDPVNPKITVELTGKGALGPDLTGEWESPLLQTCKETKSGTKCKITGSFTVRNDGDQDAKSSIIKFYLSDDGVYDPTDVSLKQTSTGSIKAGKTKEKKLTYNLPPGETAAGKYVIAVIDSGRVISESDETNNIIYGPVE